MSEIDPTRPRGRGKLTIKQAADPAPELTLEVPAEEAIEPAPARPIDRNANIKLQLGFFVAVVSGIATAAAGYIPDFQWVGFVGPLVAITGFYVFGLVQGFVQRSDTRQQFADSCYFLGFLLTMVAMLVGFLPAGLLGEEITSQGILRHFSMALGATALGLVFRILALQGGRSLGQIAAEVEATLTQYARKVSEEARNIGNELAGLHAEIELQRQQVSSIVTTDLKDAVQAAFEPITKSVTAISTSLENQAGEIAKSATAVQKALGDSAAQLNAAAQVRDEANEAAQTAVTSVADALGKFETQMGELRAQLSQVVSGSTAEIEKMTRAFEQGSALAPALGPVLDRISTNINDVSQRIDRIKGQSDALAERVSNNLADDGRMFGDLENVQASIVQAGNTARDGIAREGDATRQALANTRTAMEQMLDTERRRVADQFNSEIAAATDRLSAILRDFAAKIEEARGGAPR